MSGPPFPIGRCSYSGIVPSGLAALLCMRNGSGAGRKMFERSHRYVGEITGMLVMSESAGMLASLKHLTPSTAAITHTE